MEFISDVMGAVELLSLMENGKISAVEYAAELSVKVSESGGLNAIQSFDKDSLMKKAMDADQKRQHGTGGILCGLPFIAKDNLNSTDFPTTAGTNSLMGLTTSSNAGAIDDLLKEDAILGAKASMHELAFGITSNNAVTGPVRNPVNMDKIPGGSSGGTAAAVGRGIFPIGLGTDTGGSCRIPAALCGVVGFRPSTGRYSSEGVVPITHTRDTVGTIARNVSDISLFDSVLSGNTFKKIEPFLDGITLGIPKEVFFDNLESEVEKVIQTQLSILEKSGILLKEISMAEIWSHNEAFGFPVALYEVMKDLPAYLEKYVANVNFSKLVSGIGSPDVAGVFASQMGADAIPEAVYNEAINTHRPAMKNIYNKVFSDNGLNGIVFPTTPLTARDIGEDETVDLNGTKVPTFPTYIRNTDLGSNIGAPGISLPCSGETSLPIGIEIDGLPDQDQKLLSLANAIEMMLTS